MAEVSMWLSLRLGPCLRDAQGVSGITLGVPEACLSPAQSMTKESIAHTLGKARGLSRECPSAHVPHP